MSVDAPRWARNGRADAVRPSISCGPQVNGERIDNPAFPGLGEFAQIERRQGGVPLWYECPFTYTILSHSSNT
ncbi:unnamed protein product, partial [Mesorhabditis spiculigera]